MSLLLTLLLFRAKKQAIPNITATKMITTMTIMPDGGKTVQVYEDQTFAHIVTMQCGPGQRHTSTFCAYSMVKNTVWFDII